MRILLVAALISTVSPSFAQDWARATYSTNEKMIEIADLQGLQSCSVMNVSGKVTKIKVSDNSAAITVKREDNEKVQFNVPLNRVRNEDRGPMFHHLVTKGNTLEVAGYRCNEGSPPSAFSIRRVY
jgi:hypothetical protein